MIYFLKLYIRQGYEKEFLYFFFPYIGFQIVFVPYESDKSMKRVIGVPLQNITFTEIFYLFFRYSGLLKPD